MYCTVLYCPGAGPISDSCLVVLLLLPDPSFFLFIHRPIIDPSPTPVQPNPSTPAWIPRSSLYGTLGASPASHSDGVGPIFAYPHLAEHLVNASLLKHPISPLRLALSCCSCPTPVSWIVLPLLLTTPRSGDSQENKPNSLTLVAPHSSLVIPS